MKRTATFRSWTGAVIVTVTVTVIAAALVLSACAPAAAPSKPTEPAKPSAAATAAPASQATKAPEATNPPAQAPKSSAPSGPLAELKFAETTSFSNAPIYYAMDKGYMKEAGVEVKFDNVAGAGDAVPFLATGQLDMAGGGLSAANFNSYARGLGVKIVAPLGIMPLDHGAVRIVLRNDHYDKAPTKTAADLKGKKIAINTRGGIVEYQLTKALQKVKLDLKDVETVLMPFPDMPNALAGNQVDAIVAAEPFATRAVQLNAGKVLTDDIVPGKATTYLLASPSLMKDRPDVLRNFMVAYMRGVRDLADQGKLYDEDRMAIWVKYVKLQPEVLKAMVPFIWDPDLNMPLDIIQDQQKVHMDHGLMNYQQPIDVGLMIDDSFTKYARDKLGPWKKP